MKVVDFFVVQPHSRQNGSSLTKRIGSQSMFHVRLPHSGKFVVVFELENPFTFFFIVYPITFSIVVVVCNTTNINVTLYIGRTSYNIIFKFIFFSFNLRQLQRRRISGLLLLILSYNVSRVTFIFALVVINHHSFAVSQPFPVTALVNSSVYKSVLPSTMPQSVFIRPYVGVAVR